MYIKSHWSTFIFADGEISLRFQKRMSGYVCQKYTFIFLRYIQNKNKLFVCAYMSIKYISTKGTVLYNE